MEEQNLFNIMVSWTLGLVCAGLYDIHSWNILLLIAAICWWTASLYFLLVYVGLIKKKTIKTNERRKRT